MRQITLLFIAVISYLVVLSCNAITQKQFEFFYYPEKNIYYDVANNQYFFSLDGGKNWDSMYAASNQAPALLGSKQIIYNATPDVWINNQQHLRQYNGHAININGSDSLQKDLVSERKIKKPAPIPVADTEKKPEKKPGFFKRLFGKKNNNNK